MPATERFRAVMSKAPVCLLVGAISAGCGGARTAPAMQVVDGMVAALGGRAAIDASPTVVQRGTGDFYVVGQGPSVADNALRLAVTELTREVDVAGGRWRQSAVLTPQWAAQSRAPEREILALDGDVAFDVDPSDQASRAPDPAARNRRDELLLSPLGIARAALAPGAVVSNRRRAGADDVVDVHTASGRVVTLTVDAATGLPRRIETLVDDALLGDVVVATELADYARAGALMLPTRITSKLDEAPVGVIQVETAVGGAVGELAAPAEIAAAAATNPAPEVQTEVLAPGVWLLNGGSHHSVVVELADRLLLVEAPADEARTLAVIAHARTLVPAKPLTHVVTTHHHADHVAGVRGAVSEGLAVIAHERAAAFLEQLVARPHTLAPDALARAPRSLTLVTVATEHTLDDATRPVQLLALPSPHADTMLVVYLPRERLLVEADLYTPRPEGAPPLAFPNARYLVELVESRRLAVDRVIPLHRRTATYAELVEAARSSPPPPPTPAPPP